MSDENGWFSPDDCDALLWHGLASAAGHKLNLTIAEYEPGVWHRRPPPSCWDMKDNGSRSSISQDMLLGVMWAAWRNKNLPIMERLAKYGEENQILGNLGWRMGEPYPEEAARVVLRPNNIGLVGRILYKLSEGDIDRNYRTWPSVYSDSKEDYERHLQILSLALNAEVSGLSVFHLVTLQKLAEANPKDRLFQAVYQSVRGDYVRAIDVICDNTTSDPSYVRGGVANAYSLVHKIFASEIILRKIR